MLLSQPARMTLGVVGILQVACNDRDVPSNLVDIRLFAILKLHIYPIALISWKEWMAR